MVCSDAIPRRKVAEPVDAGMRPVDGGEPCPNAPGPLLKFLQPSATFISHGTSQTMTTAAALHPDADIHERLQVKQYREAFALLLPRYRDKVFRLTFSMLRNRATAEDITQEILVRVWRALPGYGAQAALSTWVYAISKNACLSELRKRRPVVSLDDEEGAYDAEVAALGSTDADDSATVSVTQLLDQLPERYRQAVTLFYMEDKSYEQTATSLGLPLGTVKALLHRARKRLTELVRETESA